MLLVNPEGKELGTTGGSRRPGEQPASHMLQMAPHTHRPEREVGVGLLPGVLRSFPCEILDKPLSQK